MLGDLWLLESLKVLALSKLHETLRYFGVDKRKVGDVMKLLRYVYHEDGRADSDEKGGGLGELVCAYLAIHSETFNLDKRFIEFLEEGGQFVKDVWRYEVGKNIPLD